MDSKERVSRVHLEKRIWLIFRLPHPWDKTWTCIWMIMPNEFVFVFDMSLQYFTNKLNHTILYFIALYYTRVYSKVSYASTKVFTILYWIFSNTYCSISLILSLGESRQLQCCCVYTWIEGIWRICHVYQAPVVVEKMGWQICLRRQRRRRKKREKITELSIKKEKGIITIFTCWNPIIYLWGR